MLIVCPSCATSYDVTVASLEPNGRQVRCARCRAVWRAEPRRSDLLVAAAQALAPGSSPVADLPPMAAAADGPQHTDYSGAPAALEPASGAAAEPAEAVETTADPYVGPVPDAGPEVEAPPIVPVDLDDGRPPIDIGDPARPPPAEDIETVAARRAPQPRLRRQAGWPMSPLQGVTLALVILDAILIGWRKDIVRALPQTAAFYSTIGLGVNLRGLDFADVTTVAEAHEGVPILVVQGKIVNEAGATVGLPRLKLAVRNAARQEIYAWTTAPPRASLPPGQAVAFRTRLASPPPGTSDILVRFITRRDMVADSR